MPHVYKCERDETTERVLAASVVVRIDCTPFQSLAQPPNVQASAASSGGHELMVGLLSQNHKNRRGKMGAGLPLTL